MDRLFVVVAESRRSPCVWGVALGGWCALGKELGLIMRVAARAVVGDAEQHVPSRWREAERRSAAEAQPKYMKRCETGI